MIKVLNRQCNQNNSREDFATEPGLKKKNTTFCNAPTVLFSSFESGIIVLLCLLLNFIQVVTVAPAEVKCYRISAGAGYRNVITRPRWRACKN